MSEQKQKIVQFFSELSAQSMHLVDLFYSPDAEFADPMVSLRGRGDIRKYYEGLYQSVTSISFQFPHIVQENDYCSAAWVMTLAAPKLNSGKPFSVPGVSHIRFDLESNLVLYHRDYFDMGAFIYERIPLVGAVIRSIKSRLH